MATSVDSVVLQLEARLGQYNSDVAGAANASERALTRIDTAATRTEKTLGSTRIGMQQLSYQIGDVAQQFALGVRPQVIFAQQAGQVVQAVQLLTGGASKFATFMAGPWGIALTAATVVLAPFIGGLLEGKSAIDEMGEAADRTIAKLDKLASMQLGAARAAVADARIQIVQQQGLVRGLQGQLTPAQLNGTLQGLALKQQIDAAQKKLSEMQMAANVAELQVRNRARYEGAGGAAAASSGGSRGSGGGGRGRTASQAAEDVDKRFNDQLISLAQQTLSARESVAASADEKAELELRSVELSRQQALSEVQSNKAYFDANAKAYTVSGERLRLQIEALADAHRERIEFDRRRGAEQETADLANERRQAEHEALQNQYDLAKTEADRRRIALQIFDAEDAYLKAMLDRVITAHTLNGIQDQEAQKAQIALDALNASATDRRDLVSLQHQGPLGRYADSLADPKTRVEAAIAQKLDSVNQGITDALAKDLGIKDKFVKDLFSIFLDNVIFRPLAQALDAQRSGGGGGLLGAIGGVVGGLFGKPANLLPAGYRASGGPVSAGTPYMVGEQGRELFVPQSSGMIVSNQQLRGGSPGGGTSVVRLELSGDIDARIQRVSGPVAVEIVRASAPNLIDASANETMRRAGRLKM